MPLLSDRYWKHKYSRDDGDLIGDFYVPALECAVRYDRSTGYFTAGALSLAARGLYGLLANEGRMRLLVGCTLDTPEIDAITHGETLRAVVDSKAEALALPPPGDGAPDGLALLASLIARGLLQIRVAVPCDELRRPVPANGIFHAKTGIIEDKTGEKLAFSGSLNETGAGWKTNFESFHVFTTFAGGQGHVDAEEEEFQRLWEDQSPHAVVLEVPAALEKKLLHFLPKSDKPATKPPPSPTQPPPPLTTAEPLEAHDPESEPELLPPTPDAERYTELRNQLWSFIAHSASQPNGGERVGETTSAIEPWPHQVRAFQRMYSAWPPKLLIADEVGLGKTIEAGLLLRQAWLARRAKRILILAPKAVIRQWQLELRDKFNLNWPIYDGHHLQWARTPLSNEPAEKEVSRNTWHQEPCVLVSSHLVRRTDRAAELLEAEPWDLVIVDEAHHARRRGDETPNALLRLLRELRSRTQGLVLLTATPMQVSPVEVWDLMNLLGLPVAWSPQQFLRYFELLSKPNLLAEEFDSLARLFQATESAFGPTTVARIQSLEPGISRLRADRILRALRSKPNVPRKMLAPTDKHLALSLLRQETPVRRLISRHTRELLRRYRDQGKLTSRIANRHVVDEFVDLSPAERQVYEDVEDYISSTWDRASVKERNAVGFVMTIYRRRLASSFAALANTLEKRANHLVESAVGTPSLLSIEDIPDEEESILSAESTEPLDAEDTAELEQESLAVEEQDAIAQLLSDIRRLPSDTKAVKLRVVLEQLRTDGYRQVMVFTQYTDTLDFLRAELAAQGVHKIMCFSGRGGEIRKVDGSWQLVSREEIKRRFRNNEAEILLCTDAAAEGLNFQFCGALVNYDMPWNPMRVEQRIGRIDRLGQAFDDIRIVNLHYSDTVEADVYLALRERIGLFSQFIGRLQPILARLPGEIREVALQSSQERRRSREELVSDLRKDVDEHETGGFDLDEMVAADLDVGALPRSPLTLDHLDRILRLPVLLPSGFDAIPLGKREYSAALPDRQTPVRITTNRRYFDEHPESTELWSPGSGSFPPLNEIAAPPQDSKTIDDLLDEAEALLDSQVEQAKQRTLS